MRRSAPLLCAALSLLALVVVGLGARSRLTRDGTVREVSRAFDRPAPTEHFLGQNEEARKKEERMAWIEEMHRAAPDVAWRAVERANGLAEMERRRDLPGGLGPGRWCEVGSRNQAGRMHCAMLGPPDAQGRRQLYAGSALGGLWRSDPDGSSFTALGDNLYGGVYELVVIPGPTPLDPDLVMVLGLNDDVFVTRDQGGVWEMPAGLEDVTEVRSLSLIEAGATFELLVLARASPGGSPVTALYASADRGVSFQLRHQWPASYDASLWAPREATVNDSLHVLYQGECQESLDGGRTWLPRGTVHAGASEAILTGSEAGAPDLYAAVRVGGVWQLHHSANAGLTFTYRRDLDDFWGSLAASTLDPSLVVYGGVEAWRSTDAGLSFTRVNGWGEYYGDPANKLHADLPGIHCYPDPDQEGAEIWYFSTDGGLYESRDQVASVQNLSLSGLGVSQYYSTLTSSRDPDLIQAGSQDQGYQRGIYQPPEGSGPSTDFDQLISGDYGHLTSGDGTHDLVFSTYPGFVLIAEGETDPVLHTTGFPAGVDHLWLPPVVANPLDVSSFFFAGSELLRAERSGNTWTYQTHTSFDFTEGGAASYLTAAAFAPEDPSFAYAVNSRGSIFRSEDFGVTWTRSSTAPGEHYFYGNAIAVNPHNPKEVMIGGSGYSAAGAMYSTSGGRSFVDADLGLPDTLIYDLAYSCDGQYVYAATEAGAYRFDFQTQAWQNVMESHTPLTTYWSVEAVPGSELIRFGTYGRGIWDYTADVQAPEILFSLQKNRTIDGVDYDDGDVLSYACGTGVLSLLIDIGDVIPGNVDVDALCLLDDGTFLLSFRADETIPGLTGGPGGDDVADEDVVRFLPTSLGEVTEGSFEFYFDGSDVGLGLKGHDVDALGLDTAGRLHLSLSGEFDLPADGLSGKDEDVLCFAPFSLGADTAGTFTMLIDGSDGDVKLGQKSEDVWGYDFDRADGTVYLTTQGDFQVPAGLPGEGNDVLWFVPVVLGADPDGEFRLLFTGDSVKRAMVLDALDVNR